MRGFSDRFLVCKVIHCVIFSFAIISLTKRDLVEFLVPYGCVGSVSFPNGTVD